MVDNNLVGCLFFGVGGEVASRGGAETNGGKGRGYIEEEEEGVGGMKLVGRGGEEYHAVCRYVRDSDWQWNDDSISEHESSLGIGCEDCVDD